MNLAKYVDHTILKADAATEDVKKRRNRPYWYKCRCGIYEVIEAREVLKNG